MSIVQNDPGGKSSNSKPVLPIFQMIEIQIMALNIAIHGRNCGRERKIYMVDAFQKTRGCILPLNTKTFSTILRKKI